MRVVATRGERIRRRSCELAPRSERDQCDFCGAGYFCSFLSRSFPRFVFDYGECWKNACPRVHDMDANDEFLQEFVFGVWRIWKVRNDMVFRGTMWNPTKALELWRGQVSEFRDVMVKIDNQGPWHPGSILSARGVQGGWKKPKFGNLKLRWCLELKDKFLASPPAKICLASPLVPQEGNLAAHEVASFATKHGGEFIWDEIGPDFLFNILAANVNLVIRL
ncbi:hypothetical protein EV1_023604 [Malus domestica]